MWWFWVNLKSLTWVSKNTVYFKKKQSFLKFQKGDKKLLSTHKKLLGKTSKKNEDHISDNHFLVISGSRKTKRFSIEASFFLCFPFQCSQKVVLIFLLKESFSCRTATWISFFKIIVDWLHLVEGLSAPKT